MATIARFEEIELYRDLDRKYILQKEFDSFSVQAMKIGSLFKN